jgi:hypothetical protein
MAYYPCDHCSNELTPEDAHVCHACTRPSFLCDGCTYECADCEWNFCIRHVRIEELPDHMAIYRCERCEAKREREREAA